MPPDFGPIYAETDLSRFPVEPWNAVSNLVFLGVAIYILKVTKLDYKKFPLLVVSLPILLVGFVGGTVFHATRTARIWLLMDYLPIMILSLLVSTYLLSKGIRSKVGALAIVSAWFILARWIFSFPDLHIALRITFGYGSLALIILASGYIAAKESAELRGYLLRAGALFIAALCARYMDSYKLLPMGTHFLWHLLGGASVFCLVQFILKIEQQSHLLAAKDHVS